MAGGGCGAVLLCGLGVGAGEPFVSCTGADDLLACGLGTAPGVSLSCREGDAVNCENTGCGG